MICPVRKPARSSRRKRAAGYNGRLLISRHPPMSNLQVTTFYRFAPVPDCHGLRDDWDQLCREAAIVGTILIAPEGVNATIAGRPGAVERVLAAIQAVPGFASLDCKHSRAAEPPFRRLKVRVREEIISMGVPEADPARLAGEYVEPEDWNALISDPDVLLIDTRNDYEARIGTFRGARILDMQTFREFPRLVDAGVDPGSQPRVAMFCTGGIRCEKASAYMKLRGFDAVYHLKGGILRYLEQVDAADSLWDGECFVFDERVAVGQGLEPGTHTMCPACGGAVADADRTRPGYEEGVSCPQCVDRISPEQRRRFRERRRQAQLAARRREDGKGRKVTRRSDATGDGTGQERAGES